MVRWLILSADVVKVGAGSIPWATEAAVAFASGFSPSPLLWESSAD